MYWECGIVDGDAFDGRPAADSLPPENDPRSATAEERHAILEAETAALANVVRQKWAAAVR